MATEVRLRNPATGDETLGYKGYSWTTLCFGAFPTLLRGDILLGLAVFLAMIVLGIGALASGLPTWLASGVVGGVWGFFYNDIHLDRLRRAGYEVMAEPARAVGQLN